MSQCRHAATTVSNNRSFRKTTSLFEQQWSEVGATVTSPAMRASHPLRSSLLYKSSSRVKVSDAASGP